MNEIKLIVCGTELTFEPNQTAYNKFINEMAMDNKVAPAHNYLMRIVSVESKEPLSGILQRPGAALFGVGMAVKTALQPAIEMYDALNTAAANGVDSGALDRIQKDAQRFSMTYGTSAVEFVQSTESIGEAIYGLSNDELPKVVKIANTLAYSLKASTQDTAQFMGQMYENFVTEAEKFGKVDFAEKIADKMVYLRQTFGYEMATIKSLMMGSKGAGSNLGVGMDEQAAVMAQLHRTLGSRAGKAYEGFLSNAITGAKKLGLSFTDAGGNLLTMPQMLLKLQTKYGKSIEGNLQAQGELNSAFGSSAAVVKSLYGNVNVLQRHITELGGSDGLKRTQELANKLVKPWDRFIAILKAIQTVIGLTLIPVLYPFLNKLADMGQTFARWMQLFPNIARAVGFAAMVLLSFAAVGAVANIVMGVSSFIMMGLRGIWVALTSIIKIWTAAVWLAKTAALAWNATLKLLRGTLLAIRMAAILSGVAINFMSWPILLIIGGIVLLVAGCYLLAKHWDAIKAAVMDTQAFKTVANVVEWLGNVFSDVWQWIADGWDDFVSMLAGFSPSEALSGMVTGIVTMFDNIWLTIKNSFLKSWNWIVRQLNKIPGVNISLTEESSPQLTTNTLSTGGDLKSVERGGLSKFINTNSKSISDNSRKIGTVNIYPKEALSPGKLMEWQELGA